ncbi:MAG: Asp-tRNA(Asn)/Glu-tRNA(Gln) amidotransferase subunit GatB [Minisyncoccia bacterium]|jgi:aspartyl-tRNA(Asn)/glutamyl-tRNA(Gln) amidotransferase subunit B
MYIPTIGLEIHAELKTKTKMFCGCKNDGAERRPNVNVCPICLGHPGTLPTINKQAVENVLKLGLALGGKIPDESHFDRKSYFYPDLPKGYQISQYEHPLVEQGLMNGVRITRIHLEEDAGRLNHADDNSTLVDFNRAGVPLMELVTEPDIKNAEETVAFAQELQLILRYLDISDADMENGQMRIEANISIAPKDAKKYGTKVEVKNINSFKAVHDAIEYELKRQEEFLSDGKKIAQETRGWNDKKFITESQRSKEEANDYRYFPEPDLPPLKIKEAFDLEKLKDEIPELPEKKRERFGSEFGLDKKLVETIITEKPWADYFEQAASELESQTEKPDYQLLANYFTSDLKSLIKDKNTSVLEMKFGPEHLAHLIALIGGGKLSSRLAKDLLAKMFETGEDPETLMKSQGLELVSDEGELGKAIDGVLQMNGKSVADFKKGKLNALQFLLGQVMAKTKGKADPNIAKKILEEKLK